MPRRSSTWTVAACLFALAVGCGGESMPEIGVVTGTLTARGKPLKGMGVTFMPDPGKGNMTPINASATSDDAGKFELRYAYKGRQGAGAPVGWHRVTVLDNRYASVPQGAALPPRLFSVAYSAPTTTPLSVEVKPGEQTIDLELQ